MINDPWSYKPLNGVLNNASALNGFSRWVHKIIRFIETERLLIIINDTSCERELITLVVYHQFIIIANFHRLTA